MRRRTRIRSVQAEENFWPSFTDMISTIALILFFLILIIFVENIIIAKDLSTERQALLSTEEALVEREKEMAVLNAQISDKESNLMLLQDEAEALKLEVEQGQIALKLSEDQILEQQKIIAQSNKELGDMRTQVQALAVIRVSILERVVAAIEAELQKADIEGGDQVYIGENGNIILNNTLLFGSNESTIGKDGRLLVGELAQVFENILDDATIRNYIDAIQIEGHTDDTNTSDYNRELSTKRASNVVSYMFDVNGNLEEKYGAYFVASGYSEFRPLDFVTPEQAAGMTREQIRARNRRIEISIILKDSNIQDIIDGYLEKITASENEE